MSIYLYIYPVIYLYTNLLDLVVPGGPVPVEVLDLGLEVPVVSLQALNQTPGTGEFTKRVQEVSSQLFLCRGIDR